MNKAPAIKLGIILLVITVSYSFFWFVRTGQTEKKINNLISKNSSTISASAVSVSGFPFSQKITISDLKFNIPSISKYQVTIKKLEASTGIFSKSFSANILEQVTVFDNDSNTIRNIEFKESPKINISFNNEGISSFNYQDSGYTILEDQKPPFYSSSSNIIKMEAIETANSKLTLKFNIDIKEMEGISLASIYQNVFEKKIIEGIKTGEITIGNNINNATNSTLLINPEQQMAITSNQINPANSQAPSPIKPELKPAIELGSNSSINNPQAIPQQQAPQQAVPTISNNNPDINQNPNNNSGNNSGTLNNNQPINQQEAVKIASQSGSPALAQQVSASVNNVPAVNSNGSVVNSVNTAPSPANNAPAIANNANGQAEQPKLIIEPNKQNQKFNLSLDFEYTIINSSEPSIKKENIATTNAQPATEQANNTNIPNPTANNNASNGNPSNIPPVPNNAVNNQNNPTAPNNAPAPTLPEISPAHKSEMVANSGYSIKINNFELSSNEIKFTANGQIDNFIDDNSPSGSVTLKIDKFPSFNIAISSAVENIKSNILAKQNKGLSQQNNIPYDNFLNKINEKLFLILEEISKKNALTKPETAVLEIRREKNLEFIINETPMREIAGKF